MAGFSKFRTSVGGFNRTDVSDYIERLCAEHQKMLQQYKTENEALAEKLTQTEASLARQKQDNAALAEKLQEMADNLRETEAALQEALYPTEEEPPEAEEELPEAEAPDYPVLELEAYRRAEAAERLAMERAARLRQTLNDLLDSVSNRYEETGQEIHVLTEDIRTNLKRLEDTLSDLDLLFDETTGTFDTLNTGELAVEV